ncbi:MAG: DUF4465 domain-containing protein [Bacteroidales bacterium]|nr:DUF4465 domain-containing protein [Bacteroidales bacterium]
MKKKCLKILTALMLVSIVIGVKAQQNVDFEELVLEPESHWNGADNSGFFISKGWKFINEYDDLYGSWMGWSYTNETDNETNDWSNEFSSASGTGVMNSENYATAYVGSDWMNNYEPIPCVIMREDNQAVEMFGTFISLNANSSLYMANNDFYSDNKHYLKLIVTAQESETQTDVITREFILADYRFSNPENNFKFDDWQFIDLSWAASAYKLEFFLETSDAGDWGINTPSYFCIDNFNSEYPYYGFPQMYVETPEPITISTGESVDLNVLVGGGIQPYTIVWDDDETLSSTNGANVTASPNETTTYTVHITDAYSTSSFNIIEKEITVIVSTVSVESIAKSNVKVYPNPSSDFVNITNLQANSLVEIIDLQGRTIASFIANENNANISVFDFAKGIYQLRISLNGESIIKKLIVQ